MKKLGNLYTMAGSINATSSNDPFRIQLFDGKYTTAYRIEYFAVHNNGDNQTDVQAVLTTDILGTSPLSNWDFGNNLQIGWAKNHWWNFNAGTLQSEIDPENLVIQDLFVYSTSGQRCNYVIYAQKYDISEWQGALQMVRNRSQG